MISWSLLIASYLVSLVDPRVLPSKQQVTVKEIRIDGNYETKRTVIEKLVDVHKGQHLTQGQLTSLLQQSRQNLVESQYFNDVQVFDLERVDPSQAVILIDVEESDPWHYGASTNSVYVARDNIGGRGIFLGADVGFDKQQVDSTFNWLFASRFFNYDQIGHINQKRLIIESSSKESFLYEATWGEAGLGWRFTPRINIVGGIRSEFINNSSFRISQATASQYGVYDDSRLVLGRLAFISDLRDQTFDSHNGNYLYLWEENTIDPLGTGYSYTEGQMEIRNYFEVFSPSVIALRLRGGGATPNLPYFKYFSISGIEGLRGTGYSHYLGNKSLIANLEARFHLFDLGIVNTWVELSPFVDYGRSWAANEVPAFPLFWATGLALRVRVPYPYAMTLRIEEGWDENGFATYWSLDNPF